MELATRRPSYRPLQGSHIRVVQFRPFSPALDNYDRIEGKISYISLDSSADYFALSYVWGDVSQTCSISLDGNDFAVTKNLRQAILQVRNRVNPRREPHDAQLYETYIDPSGESDSGWENYAIYWWIDAISINQHDIAEKSKQVPRMKRLYSTATRVVICYNYLFREISDLETAQVVSAAERYYQAAIKIYETSELPNIPNDRTVELLANVVENPEVLIRPLVGILMPGPGSWHFRTWTVQEAVLARIDPAIIIRSEMTSVLKLGLLQESLLETVRTSTYEEPLERLDLTTLGHAHFMTLSVLSSRLRERNTVSLEQHRGISHRLNWLISKIKGSFRTPGLDNEPLSTELVQFGQELLQALSYFLGRLATVPHDRLYGLMGLTSMPDLPHHLQPNYEKSFEEVCFDFTKFIISSTGSLVVLSMGVNRSEGQPTWVSDFSTAAGGPTASTKCSPVFSIDGRCLTVTGIRLGRAIAIHDDQALRAMGPGEIAVESLVLDTLLDFAMRIIRPASEIRQCDVSLVLNEWAANDFVKLFGGNIDDVSFLVPIIEGRKTLDKADPDALKCLPAMCTLFQLSTHLLLDDGTICQWFHSQQRLDELAEVGDYVYVLRGTFVPTMLRPRSVGDGYSVLGICWPHPVHKDNYPEAYFEGKVEHSVDLY